MSYASLEQSVRSGKPIECFRFTCGDRAWRYTSHDQEVYHEWRQVWHDEGCGGTDDSAYPYATYRYGHESGYIYSVWNDHRGVRPKTSYNLGYGLSALRAQGGVAGVRFDTVLCMDDYYNASRAGVAWGFDPAAMISAPTTTPYYAVGISKVETYPTLGLYCITDQSATVIAEVDISSHMAAHCDRFHYVPVSVQARGNSVRVLAAGNLVIDTTATGITWSDALAGTGLWYQGSNNIGYPATPYMATFVEDYLRIYARDYAGDEGADAPAPNHYTPAAVFRGEVEQDQEDKTGSIDITLPAASEVALLFRDFLPPSPVHVVVFRNHDGDLGAGIVHFSGTVSAVEFKGSEAVLTCLPLSEAFRRPIPWQMFQSQCGHPLYSAACGVDRATYAVSATVTAVNATGSVIQADAFGLQADRWFCSGWVEHTESGEIRWVVGHTGTSVTLAAPFSALAVGDAVTIYPGCDRTEAVCETKFSNLANFAGWSHIPSKNPFNSSLT